MPLLLKRLTSYARPTLAMPVSANSALGFGQQITCVYAPAWTRSSAG
jgi:hypothetical protein